MAKGRKVEIQFKKFDKAKDQLLHLKEVATFHVWGYRQVKTMPGAPKVMVPETVAVCELSCGEIRLVSPEKVKFLEPEKERESYGRPSPLEASSGAKI